MLLATQARKGPPVAALSAVSEKIWALKYRLADAASAPIEQSIEDTWDRVATALAASEADPALRQVRAARIHQEGCDICTACGGSRCL